MNDTDEPVLKVERDDATLQLTLNRPHSANALNLELTELLREQFLWVDYQVESAVYDAMAMF